MAHYRVYLINDLGHVTGAVDLDCADDAEAISAAEQIPDPRARELWQSERRVTLERSPENPQPGEST